MEKSAYTYEVMLVNDDGVIIAVAGTNDEVKAMRNYQRYVDEARGFGYSVIFTDNAEGKVTIQ